MCFRSTNRFRISTYPILSLLMLLVSGLTFAAQLTVTTPLAPTTLALSTEGTLDWMHFGLNTDSDINGKAGTNLLTYTAVGSAPSRFSGAPEWTSMSFSGGEPTASGGPSTANVFWWGVAGRGFSFTVPADTSTRTLKVYLGGWNSSGNLQVSSSDGSAPAVNLPLSGTSIYDRVATVVFSAATAGQSVTLTYTQVGTSGLVALQGASLSGPAYNQAPVLGAIGNRSVQVGQPLSFNVSATDDAAVSGLVFDIQSSTPALPVGVTLTGNGNGTATFNWTPVAANVGTYAVTFRVRDLNGTGLSATQTIQIQVTSGASGALGVTTGTSPSSVVLSTEGTLDWLHFGLVNTTDINGKAATTLLSSTYVGGNPSGRYVGAPGWSDLSWTGGEPTATGGPSNVNVFWASGAGKGFTIAAPADTTTRTLKVYLGGWNSTGTLQVSLSDGSAATYSQSISNPGLYANVVTVTYAAASAGQTLTASYLQTSAGGLVGVQGATLSGGAPANQAPVLAAIGNRSVQVGQPLSFNVSATDDAAVSGLVFDIQSSTPSLPAGATLTGNGNGTATFNWTPVAGDVGTYATTFRVRDLNGNGLSDDEQVTVTVSAVANQAPVLGTIGNRSVQVGQPLSFNVSATDDAAVSGLVFDIQSSTPSLPAGATLTGNGNGTATFNWTPVAANVGAYAVNFRVRDLNGAGLSDEELITVTVNAASGGALGYSVAAQPGSVNLTALGNADWMHFGLVNATDINRKATDAKLSFSTIGGNPAYFPSTTGWAGHSWTDGSPTQSGGPVTSNVFWGSGAGKGFTLTAPADTVSRTLTVYVGGYGSTGRIQASLSDGSAVAIDQSISDAALYTRAVTITYVATSANQTLTFTYTQTSAGGLVALQAATLAQSLSLTLPFTDTFADGNADGWTFANQSPVAANWSVVSQQLREQTTLETVPARVGTYHLGAFALLNAGLNLTDYAFSATAQYTGTLGVISDFPEDIGVMFRYLDGNNFYRVSMNARNGSTRLEKRVAGQFTTLAVNSRGYTPGSVVTFAVALRGSQILVEIDNDPIFAVTDTSLSTGTVALYTKAKVAFDNVSISVPGSTPAVALTTPLAYLTQSGTNVSVSALVANLPAGGSVRFQLDGGSTVTDNSAPYQTTFNGVQPGNHTVSAALLNSSSTQVDSDSNVFVGAGGEFFVQIGDSITNGTGDGYNEDNLAASGRYVGIMGQQALLVDLLDTTRASLSPTVVFNEGMGGDASVEAAFDRISSIQERYPGVDTVLIGLGTNDTFRPILSGQGCSGAACNGTYKGNMQTLVDKIRWLDYPTNTVPSFVEIRVALPPPEFTQATPWTSVANNRLREYITVIQSELTGITTGPDFFGYFMPSSDATTHRRTLFADALHPNGLGYKILSTLWHNNIEPASPVALPYVLSNLQSAVSTSLQQEVVGVGDPFRTDGAGYVVTAMPSEVVNGRWIKTLNDFTSTVASYVTFTTDRAVDVYIAFDGGATARPSWMTTVPYVDTGLDLTTTDPNAPTMRLYRASFAANANVVLGGNQATGSAGSNSNYIAIVVEQ